MVVIFSLTVLLLLYFGWVFCVIIAMLSDVNCNLKTKTPLQAHSNVFKYKILRCCETCLI